MDNMFERTSMERGIVPQYRPYVLKHFPYWTLLLHTEQYYLGRAYAWFSGHVRLHRLSEVSLDAWAALQKVHVEYERAIHALWRPDHMNYAWLGNEIASHEGHGHMHLIPRYEHARKYNGREWKDERWGKNYAPYPKLELSEQELFAIRDEIRGRLPR